MGINKHRKKLTPAERERFLALYKAGTIRNEIAKEIAILPTYISKTFKRFKDRPSRVSIKRVGRPLKKVGTVLEIVKQAIERNPHLINRAITQVVNRDRE